MSWYNSSGVCQPAIANCVTKADITGCAVCKGAGTLSGTSPKSCLPPACPGLTWYDVNWICQPAIANCVTKADLVGCSLCKGEGILTGLSP